MDNSPSLPPELTSFLEYVISGTNTAECSDHVKRIILSIGQDICRGVTNGEWKLPKHILLASTIRHLYRGKKLVTIINRLGHCESYNFIMELDNAMAMALEEVSSLVTPQIVTGENNELLHMEWDNLNKITTNIHGNNVVNHTGGIMIQEVKRDVDMNSPTQERTLPLYKRADSRRVNTKVAEKIPPFQLYKRVGPTFPGNASYEHPDINKTIYNKCLTELHIWFFARLLSSGGEKQLIPAFGGFVSATGSVPARKSTIDYFIKTDKSWTEKDHIACGS